MYPANLDTLQQNFSGDIILPGAAGYGEASKTILARGAPAIVVRPKTPNDIAMAITFARDNSLILSIRSGGHSEAGFSTNTGGLMIDLAHMNTVDVIDAEKHLVCIGGGAKWGNVAKTLEAHHLAISSGDTMTVGVGGLTLGGGFGLMVRKHGLAIDSLRGAEIVTANGEVLHISTIEHPDLFWAIRGGGGNFGVVTSLNFRHIRSVKYSQAI
jgi:FAD/FMN-containing dehydrogenase